MAAIGKVDPLAFKFEGKKWLADVVNGLKEGVGEVGSGFVDLVGWLSERRGQKQACFSPDDLGQILDFHLFENGLY